METIGTIDSVWRYPVKGMRGEELPEAVVLYSGVYGDRVCAFVNDRGMPGFPFHTGREQERMILYTPRFRQPEQAARPANWDAAAAIAPGATALFPADGALDIEVETPAGDRLAIDDPALRDQLAGRRAGPDDLRLIRSDRALTDCRPVSMFSLQTAAQLAEEISAPVDKRQFRANLFVDFAGRSGFTENDLIGKRVRVGEKVELAVVELDPRCKIITLNPDTAERNRELLDHLIGQHNGRAGLYAAVLAEGVVRPGDAIRMVG